MCVWRKGKNNGISSNPISPPKVLQYKNYRLVYWQRTFWACLDELITTPQFCMEPLGWLVLHMVTSPLSHPSNQPSTRSFTWCFVGIVHLTPSQSVLFLPWFHSGQPSCSISPCADPFPGNEVTSIPWLGNLFIFALSDDLLLQQVIPSDSYSILSGLSAP